MVRSSIAEGKAEARLPDNPEKEIMFFQVKQLQEVETLLVERGALDCGWRG
jgi:hypothetical protein